MKKMMFLILSVFMITSCVSKDISNDAKYQIASIPEVNGPELIVFLGVVIETSKLPNAEKDKLYKELEIMGAELVLNRMTLRKTIAAYLVSLDKDADPKTRNELSGLVKKLSKDDYETRNKIVALVSEKLQNNVDTDKMIEIRDEMIRRLEEDK